MSFRPRPASAPDEAPVGALPAEADVSAKLFANLTVEDVGAPKKSSKGGESAADKRKRERDERKRQQELERQQEARENALQQNRERAEFNESAPLLNEDTPEQTQQVHDQAMAAAQEYNTTTSTGILDRIRAIFTRAPAPTPPIESAEFKETYEAIEKLTKCPGYSSGLEIQRRIEADPQLRSLLRDDSDAQTSEFNKALLLSLPGRINEYVLAMHYAHTYRFVRVLSGQDVPPNVLPPDAGYSGNRTGRKELPPSEWGTCAIEMLSCCENPQFALALMINSDPNTMIPKIQHAERMMRTASKSDADALLAGAGFMNQGNSIIKNLGAAVNKEQDYKPDHLDKWCKTMDKLLCFGDEARLGKCLSLQRYADALGILDSIQAGPKPDPVALDAGTVTTRLDVEGREQLKVMTFQATEEDELDVDVKPEHPLHELATFERSDVGLKVLTARFGGIDVVTDMDLNDQVADPGAGGYYSAAMRDKICRFLDVCVQMMLISSRQVAGSQLYQFLTMAIPYHPFDAVDLQSKTATLYQWARTQILHDERPGQPTVRHAVSLIQQWHQGQAQYNLPPSTADPILGGRSKLQEFMRLARTTEQRRITGKEAPPPRNGVYAQAFFGKVLAPFQQDVDERIQRNADYVEGYLDLLLHCIGHKPILNPANGAVVSDGDYSWFGQSALAQMTLAALILSVANEGSDVWVHATRNRTRVNEWSRNSGTNDPGIASINEARLRADPELRAMIEAGGQGQVARGRAQAHINQGDMARTATGLGFDKWANVGTRWWQYYESRRVYASWLPGSAWATNYMIMGEMMAMTYSVVSFVSFVGANFLGTLALVIGGPAWFYMAAYAGSSGLGAGTASGAGAAAALSTSVLWWLVLLYIAYMLVWGGRDRQGRRGYQRLRMSMVRWNNGISNYIATSRLGRLFGLS